MNSKIMIKSNTLLLLGLVLLIFGASLPLKLMAQDAPIQNYELMGNIGKTIEDSLKAEAANVKRYREQLKQAEQENIYLVAAINGYQLQLSTYGNQLLASGTDNSTLQIVRSEIRASMVQIQKVIGEIKPRIETLASEFINLDQQQVLIGKQREALEKMSDQDPMASTVKSNAKALAQVLNEKKKIIRELEIRFQNRLENMTQVHESFSTLSKQYDTAIEQKKKRDLFERREGFLSIEAFPLLFDETGRLLERVRYITQPEFWIKTIEAVWETAGFVPLSLLIVFFAAVFLIKRIKKTILKAQQHTFITALGPWHVSTLKIIEHSILLFGISLLVYLSTWLKVLYILSPAIKLVTNFLLVGLVTKWLILAIALWPEEFSWGDEISKKVPGLIKGLRYFSWLYLFLLFLLGSGSGVLIFLRLLLSGWLIFWAFFTWHGITFSDVHNKTVALERKKLLWRLGYKYLLYWIGAITLLLDMIGYGSMSIHWLLSWVGIITILLWWTIFLFLLKEWDHYYRLQSSSKKNEFLHNEYPFQWLMIRFGQLIWFLSLILLILLALGGKSVLLKKIYAVLGHPLELGSMNFSILGVLYAALVLAITHAAARLWRWIFQKKFLTRSGMEVGLQDSITSITIYVIWTFGVLIALHVFGLNTASLAVAFGALGIGLGFGLQNIFNNFISGIILLFERPIQVGDDVEINGIWASVKKINVRSTVVQTYDNASLIIPNSEFISSQLTNWSFKDKRLRRTVTVGVAYGSDVLLVRETLLEIARTTKKVLKFPKPDVVFTDFGDSALIFKLRVWTDIENMIIVETNIRFEIDRLFRERGLEISFPQRDIHIRSITREKNSETMDGVKDILPDT